MSSGRKLPVPNFFVGWGKEVGGGGVSYLQTEKSTGNTPINTSNLEACVCIAQTNLQGQVHRYRQTFIIVTKKYVKRVKLVTVICQEKDTSKTGCMSEKETVKEKKTNMKLT